MYLVTVKCPSFDYVTKIGVIGLFETLDNANNAIERYKEEHNIEHADAEYKFRIQKYDE